MKSPVYTFQVAGFSNDIDAIRNHLELSEILSDKEEMSVLNGLISLAMEELNALEGEDYIRKHIKKSNESAFKNDYSIRPSLMASATV